MDGISSIWCNSPPVSHSQWLQHPTGVRGVVGLILVGDSDFFFFIHAHDHDEHLSPDNLIASFVGKYLSTSLILSDTDDDSDDESTVFEAKKRSMNGSVNGYIRKDT